MPTQVIATSSLRRNLQVANFQRCERVLHQRQALVTLQRILSPVADDPSALPSPIPSPFSISNSSCLFTRGQTPSASSCTVLLHFSRYWTGRLKMSSLCVCVFVHYILFVGKILQT